MTARSSRLPRRTPSGRISRAVMFAIDAHSPTAVRRLRDSALRGMHMPEYGSELGRLFLTEKITPEQFEAGKRWARLRYEMIGFFGLPALRSGIPTISAVTPGTEKDAAYEKHLFAVYTGAVLALRDSGVDALSSVTNVCEKDAACVTAAERKSLHLGLNALAVHWRLT